MMKKSKIRKLAEMMSVPISYDDNKKYYSYPNEIVSFNEKESFESLFEEIYNMGIREGKRQQQLEFVKKISFKELSKYIKELEKEAFI